MDTDVITYDLPPAKHRQTAADNPLLAWIPERQTFLDETIFWKGIGTKLFAHSVTAAIPIKITSARIVSDLGCSVVPVLSNNTHACHCIESNTQLSSLWVCESSWVTILVIGAIIHIPHLETTLSSSMSVIRFKQLLQVCWYPTTTTDPQTAATFNVLEYYHLLSFESKVSAYEFYHSLARCSDNTGLSPIKDRYSAFMRMMRISASNAKQSLQMKLIQALNAGWAYFVEETKYKEYLSVWAGEKQEHSTCVGHNAVNMANTKSARGLAATGVGTVDCACHEFKLPTRVGDLQKGEKYLNMDYFVFSALIGFMVTMLNISYDITCQWSKKLWTRMDSMPAHLHVLHDAMQIRYFVPKFHIGAHIAACQTMFSWNLASVEKADLETQDGGCSKVEAGNTRLEVEAWEEDNIKPNPFESRVASITQAAVHAQLVDLEAQELEAGNDCSLHVNVSPSILISSGIELEDQQQRLKYDIANVSLRPTDKQQEAITNRTNALQRWIDSWISIQELYMPIVSALHSSVNSNTSAMEAVLKPQQLSSLLQHEWELWHAQAHDALNEICSHLCLRSHMYKFKDKNLYGQVASTCTQNLIARVETKKDAGIEKYKRARQALESLSGYLDKWQANWWCERANLRVLEKPSNQEGLQAYAYRQAALCCAVHGSFQALWSAVPRLVESTLIPEVSELNNIHTPSIDCPPTCMMSLHMTKTMCSATFVYYML
ncbi:hypothetical protein DFJ58DRAFT_842195 [Suillus subalutaceus]|uniref:uncharacterized protein n=1 Tax=Suillus subalutaceus TaxID=48586 RepID=UPI001B872E38|nr:uncharacterized protein DFJ58DRAFT_842195 [Suillus subalutaceus]KAG1851306.1 hypothetical protein DFJ58DRAFT_842195 [Suillus subalutaceus]